MIAAEEVRVLRKSRTYLEEVVKNGDVIGFIPINLTETGVRIVKLSDMKLKGLYSTCANLIKKGKLRRYNANGTQKLDSSSRTTVYIDYDEFYQLTEL